MRRRLTAVLALTMTMVGLLASPARTDEEQVPSAGLEHVATADVGPRLQELRFRTPAIKGETRVRVLLPEGYADNPKRRYPVLYLLHGGTGSYRDWTEQGNAAAISAAYPVIVVMPDGSGYGNYVDWWNYGAGGPPMWETYHIGQLLPWIDDHYRTVGTRDGRAIAGLSMGGGGAMHYAARHPDLFTGAAAFSGAVDTNTIPVQALVVTSGLQDLHLPGAIFGLRQTEEVRWRGHNSWDLADNLEGMFLQLDTGNGMPGGDGGDFGDPVEAGVYEMMVNLHNRLTALGYPHIWNDYGAGGHTWFYWQRDLTELLPRLMDRFAQPVAPPQPFDYKTIEDDYEVWRWHVTIDRPALEFSRLSDASADGFSLTGSGQATVTTAPLFRAGARVEVAVSDADGSRLFTTTADRSGTITVPVSLGPGNPYQQLSPLGSLWALFNGGGLGEWPSATAAATFSSKGSPKPKLRSLTPAALTTPGS